MSAADRRYQIRVAEVGAEEITSGTVDFTLDVLERCGAIPVVTGSIARPIQGATEMRPFTVLLVDEDEEITQFFSDRIVAEVPGIFGEWPPLNYGEGRWRMIGRLVDLRYRLSSSDPEDDESWTTYGTGRCSGFGEMEGPGRYQMEVSDESWKARRHVPVFEFGDTTSLWPGGLRRNWRGISRVAYGIGSAGESVGNLHRVRMFAPVESFAGEETLSQPGQRGGNVTENLLRWLREDQREELDFTSTVDDTIRPGNFEHTLLRFGKSAVGGVPDVFNDWEVVSFGGLDEESLYDSLEDQLTTAATGGLFGLGWIDVWVRARPVNEVPPITWLPPPSASNPQYRGVLIAPTAPPSDLLPLHIGMRNDEEIEVNGDTTTIDHPWGTEGGYIHVADLHRRAWERMGLRYDSDALDAIEADDSFPALAPRIGDEAENPEKWLEKIRAQCGVISLRNPRGELILIDVRPVAELDFTAYPEIDTTNHDEHRWQVLGRETINLLHVEYKAYRPVVGRRLDFAGDSPFNVQTEGLDYLIETTRTKPRKGDTIADSGERAHTIRVHDVLEPSANEERKTDLLLQQKLHGVGTLWEAVEPGLITGWLQMYQDGLVRGYLELGKDLSDSLGEGDLLILNHTEAKAPNPIEGARQGKRAIRILGLTRIPSHAEAEYILTPARPIPVFEDPCPEES